MRLTKHHGLGNDFLVLLDLDGIRPVSPQDAVALCDRRRGIGADGLMRVTAGTDGADGADVTMRLLNADGSVAEMSGNGIRCLAQRSEEHTSELQSLMRISYAVFCLKKKKNIKHHNTLDTLDIITTDSRYT